MELQNDFKELLELFIAEKVEFLVVGGFALAHHGAPRYTGDMDLLVRPEPANADRILSCLGAFGFGGLGLSQDDFTRVDHVIQLGVPPVRVDLLTSISGLTWSEAWAEHEEFVLGDVEVPVIGRSALVKNKRESGRAQDLADLDALGEPRLAED